MTIYLPALYHWSHSDNHKNIQKRGLRPTTETAVWVRPLRPGFMGHIMEDLSEELLLAVCLATSPSTAWALSGAISAERGSSWDLWEVDLDEEDEVHYRPEYGSNLDEVRVVGSIPRSRIWFVGSRIVRMTGSRWYA